MTSIIKYVFWILVPFSLAAQKAHIEARIDTNQILIGEQTSFHVELSYPKNQNYLFQIHKDTINSSIEIVDLKIDTIKTDSSLNQFQIHYHVTSFDSGYYVIPAQWLIASDSGDTLLSQMAVLGVGTVAVDTSEAKIFDIKAPIEIEVSFLEWLQENYPYMLVGFITIALLLGIWYYLTKRKKRDAPIAKIVIPKESAHVLALRQLEALREKKLWQNDLFKAYYTELSDIVRNYILNRFQINSMEMTTIETISALNNAQQLNQDTELILKQVLSTSDFVKFAKAKPLANENDLALKNAIAFVEQSRLIESETISKKEESNDSN